MLGTPTLTDPGHNGNFRRLWLDRKALFTPHGFIRAENWQALCSNMPLSIFAESPPPTPPPLSDCFQLFLNPWLFCKTKDRSKYVGRFVASLRRAFHFSGVDELLCSYFNSQHPIIGLHLGLSFLLPLSSSPCPLFCVSLTLLSTCAPHPCSA